MNIKNNVEEIKKELPSNVKLLAATKKQSVVDIKEAISAGIKIIGENYVQEAEEKVEELKGKVKIHCIGHLQTNKVKDAVKMFDMIETVDSLKIAKEINKRSSKVMPVLIEVNSGKEENKNGCMPEDVVDLVKEVSKLENVEVKGLMTMTPYSKNPEAARPYFKLTKELFNKLNLEILSMGTNCFLESLKLKLTPVKKLANQLRSNSK